MPSPKSDAHSISSGAFHKPPHLALKPRRASTFAQAFFIGKQKGENVRPSLPMGAAYEGHSSHNDARDGKLVLASVWHTNVIGTSGVEKASKSLTPQNPSLQVVYISCPVLSRVRCLCDRLMLKRATFFSHSVHPARSSAKCPKGRQTVLVPTYSQGLFVSRALCPWCRSLCHDFSHKDLRLDWCLFQLLTQYHAIMWSPVLISAICTFSLLPLIYVVQRFRQLLYFSECASGPVTPWSSADYDFTTTLENSAV